jgi:hypothetical protein
MSDEPGFDHEFSVARAYTTGEMAKGYDEIVRGYSPLWLTMTVKSADPTQPVCGYNANTRKLTGTVAFTPINIDDDLCDGHWYISKANIFSANILLRPDQIERIWNVYLANPNGFRLAIQGPPITDDMTDEVGRGGSGGMRVRFSNSPQNS